MNRKALYEKTVNLLLDAYNEDKLKHGDCTACAVGNICGNEDNWRYLFVTSGDTQHKVKPDLITIYTTETGIIEIKNEELLEYIFKQGFVYNHYYSGWGADLSPPEFLKSKQQGIELIESTGYTIDELAKVEYAFESSIANSDEGYHYYTTKDPKKGQFIGLTAVLNILAQIHAAPEAKIKSNQEKLEKVLASFC